MTAPDKKHNMTVLTVAALGVVYGDIGTSPLYAVRESLLGLPINQLNILGVLSWIFWALILIISIKYLCIVLKADNEGEGGILALLALVKRYATARQVKLIYVLAIFGAGLLIGDAMLTPAISVISAVEGIHIVAPVISDWTLPIATAILIFLFLLQSHGSQKIGVAFGPIIIIWFCTIGFLGVLQIIKHPQVIQAISPYYAYQFFVHNSGKAYLLLGGVFLVVTGGEAIYADLGHFGKTAIRLGWFLVALPGLLLNYFGQGAYLLDHPDAIVNPFYSMAPAGFGILLLILATMATIIASQAVISAAFSLTRQSMLLNLYPHLPIKQTSSTIHGQIYIPQVNFFIACGTILVVLIFKTSSAIAHAYGVAVNLDMILTSVLISFIAIHKWKWSLLKTVSLLSIFLIIELIFLGSNLQKFYTGGWVPIAFAMVVGIVMFSWHQGMSFLQNAYRNEGKNFKQEIDNLQQAGLQISPGAAVFLTDIYNETGSAFINFMKLSHARPERVIIITYSVESIPYVEERVHCELEKLYQNIYNLHLYYGFKDYISIPQSLAIAKQRGLLPSEINLDTVTYFIEIPNIIATEERKTLWFFWQEKLFAFMTRNYSSNLNIEFFDLPYERTITIGSCKSI